MTADIIPDMEHISEKDIGKKVKELRKQFGFTQTDLAEKLSIPRPSISQIERGERSLSAMELARISDIFRISADVLLRPALDEGGKPGGRSELIVHFFRHGEAMDDLYNQYGGWADPELSARGINKAFTVSQELKRKGLKFDVIYTSPLKRAHQKADVLGRELGVDVKVVQYLKERNTYGLLCGMNKDVAKKHFPELVSEYENGGYVIGSERYDDFVDRLGLLFNYLRKSGQEGLSRIACVTHGKMMTAIIKEFLRMNPDELDEGCMLTVGIDGDRVYYIQSEGITFAK